MITQGDVGDRYYILGSGAAEVFIDGKLVNRLDPGEGFGEIALLRDVPRTATVRTTVPSEVFALERDTFLDAVSSTRRSFAEADEAVNRRLGAAFRGRLARSDEDERGEEREDWRPRGRRRRASDWPRSGYRHPAE